MICRSILIELRNGHDHPLILCHWLVKTKTWTTLALSILGFKVLENLHLIGDVCLFSSICTFSLRFGGCRGLGNQTHTVYALIQLCHLLLVYRLLCRSRLALRRLFKSRGVWTALLLLRQVFELLDDLGWLLITLLEVRAINLSVLRHEMAPVSEIFVSCCSIKECFFKFGEGVVLHGLVLELSNHIVLFLLVELHHLIVLNLHLLSIGVTNLTIHI